MPTPTRMARYDIRNDGAGPYGVFYCDKCGREYRSQPDIAGTIATDVGRQAMGGVLRNVPIFGRAVADTVAGQDPRYSVTLTPQQLDGAWKQVLQYFRECSTCHQIVCLSDFDEQSGMCKEDSPRRAEIAQAEAEQVAGTMKGIAGVLGLSGAFTHASEAAKAASTMTARCPKDGTLAPPGTKFCPQCGSPMIQPEADPCPKCGAETRGAKFCPQCGTKMERVAAGVCPNCGAETKGAKFCPECGTKL
jgi:hypothetical protein